MSDEDKPLEFSAKDLMPDWAQESASSPKERRRPPRENHEERGNRRGKGRGDRRGGDQRSRPPEEKPLEGLKASLEPTAAAVAGLAQLIRETLRAYPLADLAKMILKGRDRYQVRFRSEDGGPNLYFCEADGSLWASRDEAVNHLLNSKAIDTYYDIEIVEVDTPAEESVEEAVSEISEETSVEEEAVEKASAEPDVETLVLKTAQELAAHFRRNFAESAISETRNAVVLGSIPAKNLSRGLLVHLKQESEKLRRGFPLPMIQALCKEFEKQGLKFFKRGKKALHVSVVRPRAIEASTALTEQVQVIVDYLIANPSFQGRRSS